MYPLVSRSEFNVTKKWKAEERVAQLQCIPYRYSQIDAYLDHDDPIYPAGVLLPSEFATNDFMRSLTRYNYFKKIIGGFDNLHALNDNEYKYVFIEYERMPNINRIRLKINTPYYVWKALPFEEDGLDQIRSGNVFNMRWHLDQGPCHFFHLLQSICSKADIPVPDQESSVPDINDDDSEDDFLWPEIIESIIKSLERGISNAFPPINRHPYSDIEERILRLADHYHAWNIEGTFLKVHVVYDDVDVL